jgi:chromosome segregation ATPase
MNDTVKSEEQIAEEKAAAAAAAKAAKEAAAAEKKAAAEKAKQEKAAAKAKADEEKAVAKAAADAKKAEEKAAAAEAKRLAAEQKAKEREAKATTKEKVQLISQRGVTQPKAGTKTRAVWDLADKLSAEKGAPVAIAELTPHTIAAGLNDATTRTQYARWKQFHGVYGTVPKAAAPASNDGAGEQAAA